MSVEVGVAEAEQVLEERGLRVDLGAVEHHVGELGRARAIRDDVRVLGDVGRDRHRQSLGRPETEAVAAARGARQLGELGQGVGAVRLGLGVQGGDGDAVGGREVHREQRRLGPLVQRHQMVLAPGATQVDGVAFGGDFLQAPDLLVEVRRSVEIWHAQLDAAQPRNPGIRHGRTLLQCAAFNAFLAATWQLRRGFVNRPERSRTPAHAACGLSCRWNMAKTADQSVLAACLWWMSRSGSP